MSDTDDVRAVLFDLDDTLCEYRRSSGELLALSFERLGIDPVFGASEYYDRFGEFVGDSEDVTELRRRAFTSLVEERGRDPDLGVELARVYSEERDQSEVDPLPGAVEAVEALAGEYRLGLVTNGPPAMQREKLRAIGLLDAFETLVFAGFDTDPKPAAAPFEAALAELGVDPGRAVHVGNSLDSDVAGALAAGLRAVHAPAGDPRETPADPDPAPTYTVGSLSELTDPPWNRG